MRPLLRIFSHLTHRNKVQEVTNIQRRSRSSDMTGSDVKYLTQEEAINLDKELFDEYAFSVDQLMELAGLSVATAIAKSYPTHKLVWICCGPGNNGGDGLVCARHLKLFGYEPTVVCPKPGRNQLYQNLLKQCEKFNIPVLDQMTTLSIKPESTTCMIVDAVFGFSYKPPNRNKDFARLLSTMNQMSNAWPLVSIDIPSGWNVETGPSNMDKEQEGLDSDLKLCCLRPSCLVSLTAPKLCARYFDGQFHYLGGRFVPESIQEKYKLNLPKYPATDGVVLLSQK